MKKLLSLLLAVLMLFSLAACTDEDIDLALDVLDMVADALPAEGESQPAPAPEHALPDSQAPPEAALPEDGQYDDRDNVALYIHLYGKLPSNYVNKKDAERLYGWTGGPLDSRAPGMAIGGNRFGNNEGLLPEADGRTWTECDIDTIGKSSRGAKRIVFSNDGLIYYTDDHYESFTLLYGEE